MRRLSRASLALAAVILVAVTPARADPAPAALVEKLETWLDTHAPWPRRDSDPVIQVVPRTEALAMADRAALSHALTPRAFYDPESATISLIAPWDARNPLDQAILLHELAHHRQAPHHWYCPGAQEEPAYRLQAAWLAERGLEARINWIAVLLESGCSRRDIHP
jgi:hypothetical protein